MVKRYSDSFSRSRKSIKKKNGNKAFLFLLFFIMFLIVTGFILNKKYSFIEYRIGNDYNFFNESNLIKQDEIRYDNKQKKYDSSRIVENPNDFVNKYIPVYRESDRKYLEEIIENR